MVSKGPRGIRSVFVRLDSSESSFIVVIAYIRYFIHFTFFFFSQVARREKAIQKLELELLTAQENHRRALDDVRNLFIFNIDLRRTVYDNYGDDDYKDDDDGNDDDDDYYYLWLADH